jgi:ribosomal protein S18 acetylase RimI-like enzyme
VEAARPASPADIADIVALAGTARDELQPTRGGTVFLQREAPDGSVERITTAVGDEDQLVVVGTVDGVTVGYGVARLEALRDGELLGVIDDLYVLADARGVGVGEAMADALLAFCRQRGCVGVDAVALPGNRATKNFFESFGLVARAILVHRSFRTPE